MPVGAANGNSGGTEHLRESNSLRCSALYANIMRFFAGFVLKNVRCELTPSDNQKHPLSSPKVLFYSTVTMESTHFTAP
jgi:hypothetical protein